MKNPFTSETKGDPVTLDNGVITKLRFQPTVKARIVHPILGKPATMGLGDWSLLTMYVAPFITAMLAGYIPQVIAALVADWGCPCHGWSVDTTGVAPRPGGSK